MSLEKFDIAVIGGGPGGYVAAIRAAQLGKRVVLIEKDKLGGVCLNRGCIPTKALLKAAHSVHEIKGMKDLGINVNLESLDPKVAVVRANRIADQVGKGVEFLMKKNKIEVIKGHAKLKSTSNQSTQIEVAQLDAEQQLIEATNVIIATGAHYKTFPGLKHDGERIIGAWEALKMEEMPKNIAIIGAGAIGMEFAYFWNAFGVEVHLFEVQSRLLPNEDEEVSKEIERAYKKLKIKQTLGLSKIEAINTGESVKIITNKNEKIEELTFEKCLLAVGMTGTIDGIGLETIGVETERGFIKVDKFQQTNKKGIYAIGDVSGGMLLAHVASHEGIIAAEHIAGLNPHPVDLSNVPACTYCYPQISSIGRSEEYLKKNGIEYKVGKLHFRANGKAIASNEIDGFVKVLLDNEGKMLGAHIVGDVATELIHEYALFKSNNLTSENIFHTIHPHPTLGEWLSEAVMAAENRVLNS